MILNYDDTGAVGMDTKSQLLNLTAKEVIEKEQNRALYYFFKGECEDEVAAETDQAQMGQSWPINEAVDYIPTQLVVNKVKPLLKKQARFMFSMPPTIMFKALNDKDKDKVQDLQKFMDTVFEKNEFWPYTQQAFLNSTIMRRVLLRVEANPNSPIKIYYNDSPDFAYVVSKKDNREIIKIVLVAQDSDTAGLSADKQIWYKYEYYMNDATKTCFLKTSTYNGTDNLDNPVVEETDTELSELPGRVIFNSKMLNDTKGQSDLFDEIGMQDQYNRRFSDSMDSLKFNMFGSTVFTDATEDSVNKASIAPNSVIPLVSINGKTANVKRLESSIPADAALGTSLDRLEKDMYAMLSIPRPTDLSAIESAKSIKYVYEDLKGRCEEKWADWTPTIKWLINLIIECCSKFDCYPDEWNHDWDNLKFTISIKHNYPIPEDETDKKTTAMQEVQDNVKSHKEYMKEFSDVEDVDGEWNEIVKEIGEITSAQQDQFNSNM